MNHILSITLTLLLVMDPLGNVPLFLSALKTVPTQRRQRVILRELLIALVIMVVFLVIGSQFLNLLKVTQPAMTLAGGVILLLIAIKMMFPDEHGSLEERIEDEPFIVPMAVPYVAGPSILATEVVLVHQTGNTLPVLLLAVLIAFLITAPIMLASGYLERWLGIKTLTAVERLMGMILVVLAVQSLLDGITLYLHL